MIPAGILALGLAAVSLSATASTATADPVLWGWICPPTSTPPTTIEEAYGCLGGSRRFGDRQLGTTSPAQHFAVGVYDNDSFNPEIRVSGDFAQTNNCPATLSAPAAQIQGCLITVTFSPTRTGPREGILNTGTGGPTAVLTGNGVRHRTPRPGFRLSGDKTQNPQEDGPICDMGLCDVKLKVSCGVDPCTARATGMLTKVSKDKLRVDRSWRVPPGETILPGETSHLDLELAKEAQRREVRKALRNGNNVQAKVTVRATYATGKVATAKRTIKLVE